MTDTTVSTHMSEATERKVYDIEDVEIFSAGTWNGDEYTQADLDDIVQSFAEIGSKLKPYLKLGHSENQSLLQKDGLPSAGWITGLKREGDKLLAKFSGIPEKIHALLKSKAYGRVSSEIYWNLKEGGKTFKRALKAVALLGADTPAVSSLDDFINLYIEKDNYEKVKLYYIKESAMDEKEIKVYKDTINSLETEVKQYKNKLEVLEKTYTELKAETEKAKADAKAAEIKAYIDSNVKEAKILPSQVAKYTALAIMDFDAVKEIVGGMPKLVEMSMVSDAVIPEKKEKKTDSIFTNEELDDKIKAYSKEHKVSYSEAFNAVSREAK